MDALKSKERADLLFEAISRARVRGTFFDWDSAYGDSHCIIDGYINLAEAAEIFISLIATEKEPEIAEPQQLDSV